MSESWFQNVLDFHRKFGRHVGTTPANPGEGIRRHRENLMKEELDETLDAMVEGDIADIADGLADLIYVALGTAVSYGIDLRPVWQAVHEANMRKVGGAVRDDGKTLKPPGWTPPDIAGVLARQPPLDANGDRLYRDREVSETSPCVRGTWVTADHVVSLIVDGWTWADIMASHQITEDDIRACLSYAIEQQEGPTP